MRTKVGRSPQPSGHSRSGVTGVGLNTGQQGTVAINNNGDGTDSEIGSDLN